MKKLIFISLSALFISCTKTDDIPDDPIPQNENTTIVLDSVEEIGSDCVFIKGIIEAPGNTDIDTIIACWNTKPNPTLDHSTLGLVVEINSYFTFQISDLQSGESYYARVYVRFKDGSDKYSNGISFTPLSINVMFEKEYSPLYGGYSAYVEKAILTQNNYFIIGSLLIHEYHPDTKNAITKIDSDGEIVWNNVISFEMQNERIEKIIELENGTLLAFISGFNYPNWVIHLVCLSNSGNIIWSNTFDNYYSQHFRYAFEPRSNVVSIIANLFTSQYSNIESWTLISINYDGEIIADIFNDNFYTGFKYLFTSSNEILICENNLRMRKFDQSLNLVWENSGINNPSDGYLIEISEVKPENMFLVLYSKDFSIDLLVMDNVGNLLYEFNKDWEQHIAFPENSFKLSTNEYIVLSTKAYAPTFPEYTLTWIGKVCFEKGIIWQKEFGSKTYNARNPRGQFVFQNSDNEFIIFGHITRSYQDPYDNIAKVWISKIKIST